jgi:4-methylaminobutanoate oxidase (formaldehyde-forming)
VKRQATTARSFGLDMQLLGPKEAQELWPLMDVGDVVGAAFLPTDGQANPSDITLSLAKGARMAGARLFEDTKVLSVDIQEGTIKGVIVEGGGRIDCEKVVVCAGMWTRPFCAAHGVSVPLVPVEHQYMVTDRIEGAVPTLPTLRDPDRLTYWKEEVGGLVMGGYEPNPKLWRDGTLPPGFHYTLLENDFDHFTPLMEQALGRVPALESAGIKQMINGPESFTPDGMFILGEAPERANFFVGAGFNAFGIASGGGAGMCLAEWVAKGEAPFDLWSADIRRFGRPHFDLDWIRKRTYEAYGKHYTMAWPSEENRSGRPCRKSPLYETLKAQGAVFGEKLGWERPNWFADLKAGEVAEDHYTFGRPNWFEAVAREHRACREAAVVIDQTSFAKFALKGPDAEAALSWIASNDVARPVGSLVYTQMLNDHGGIEADLTVVRRAENEYYIVTGTGFATHDFDWISRNIPRGMNAQLFDITSANAVLSLMGPKAREVLQSVTRADLSNAAFPFGSARMIGIAGCPVLALRVTYVGELGWELHFPVEYATAVYAALFEAGGPMGLRNAGYRAIETLRLEKGYRAWASDIGPDYTPDEAGLGWAVKLRKNTPFRGRDAVAEQRASGVKKMMATFTTAPDIILNGRETIYRDGKRVGWLASGGFGHTVNKSIGMGYVRNPEGVTKDYVLSGRYELEVATARVPAEVTLHPLYDPKMERVKA